MTFQRQLLASCVLAATAGLVLPVAAGAKGKIDFEGVPVPETDEEKRQVFSSPSVFINNKSAGLKGTYETGYSVIMRSGDASLKGGPFGMLTDINGHPIIGVDGSPVISQSMDFSSLLPSDKFDDDGNPIIWNVTHFEDRPGAMYLTKLAQDMTTGELIPIKTRPIDFSHVRGTWVNCAGSVSPWGTHLGVEEYEPDATLLKPDGTMPEHELWEPMGRYFPDTSAGNPAPGIPFSPYDYGYTVEVKVNSFNNVEVAKHYAMGRFAVEVPFVAPDERTVYMSDDGTNVAFFMFVADVVGDLSAGTLYAAKWKQKDDNNGGRAKLKWANLGHATNQQIKDAIDAGIRFEHIFDSVPPTNGVCPVGYKSINAGHDTYQPFPGHQCLKLQPGEFAGVDIETLASRLEARRYAAMMDATTEFRKYEGVTMDTTRKILYTSMSEVSKGMEDDATGTYDIGGPNHIRLPKNKCGGIYRSKMKDGQLDMGGNPIDSEWVAVNMIGELFGVPTQAEDPASTIPAYDPESPFAANECWLDNIANPDNISYIDGYNTLVIGEDTGSGHQNDAVWAYDTQKKYLTRIQTTPYGSETTSTYNYPNINGWAYLMSVIQHPYGESDSDKYQIGTMADRAYNGYFTFPFLAED
jgi:secreted PhoX family phosphatase